MVFNKTEENWKELGAYWTTKEIFQQPETWLKTFQQVKNEKNEIKQKLQDIKEVMREKEKSKTVDYKQINKAHHTNNAKYRDHEK